MSGKGASVRLRAEGWAGLRSGDWEAARAAFEHAVAQEDGPEGQDGLGRARWWLGDSNGAIEAWEAAYTGYRRAGDDDRAVRAALLVSQEYLEVGGNRAAAEGWLARARDLLSALPDSASHGWLLLSDAAAEPAPADALRVAGEALAAARRFGDPDLELAAMGKMGLAEISLGDVERGLSHFGEAMAAATASEPEDLRTLGDLYCSLVVASELTLDQERFGQWVEVVMGFMQRHRHPALFTFCGTCCAAAEGAAGNWEERERWLRDTLRELEATGQRARCVHPATQLAALRVAQGRIEEAEHLLEGYEDLPEAVQPVVAIHLARGQTALAAARLHRRLNQIGRDNLLAAPLLALLVEVQLLQGDLEDAGTTTELLAAIADRTGSRRVEAEAELAEGSVLASKGSPDGVGHLERAVDLFTAVHMPHGAARAHLALARARAGFDPAAAGEEGRLALRAFERLGALRDADAASALLRELGIRGRTGPKRIGELSQREVEVLRLLGEGLTNAEIAARLYISTKTVASHVGNVFAKLQVRNRAEAATFALRYLSEPAAQ